MAAEPLYVVVPVREYQNGTRGRRLIFRGAQAPPAAAPLHKTAKAPGRTEFARMVEMPEHGKADGILSWHLDRLARNSVDGGRIVHLLDTGKLKALRFPTFWFENTPQGKFMLSIAFGQSKYYVDNLSENVKRGIRQKMKRGEWSWYAPTGYLNNPKTRNIEPNSETAPVIRKAFNLYATGDYTLRHIADFLERHDIRSRYGKVMRVPSVQQMLKNPVYCGLMQCASCGCAITAQRQKGHHYYHCTKKKGPCDRRHYLREEKMLDQVKNIVEQVSLPDDWAENMLQQLEKDRDGAQHAGRPPFGNSKNGSRHLIRSSITSSIFGSTAHSTTKSTSEKRTCSSIAACLSRRTSVQPNGGAIIG